MYELFIGTIPLSKRHWMSGLSKYQISISCAVCCGSPQFSSHRLRGDITILRRRQIGKQGIQVYIIHVEHTAHRFHLIHTAESNQKL